MTTWDERKRQCNIELHGLDFTDADAVWDGFTITREDIRERYGETRLVTFGRSKGRVVVLVHSDRNGEMHVISMRKAEPHETRYYLEAAEDFLGRKG